MFSSRTRSRGPERIPCAGTPTAYPPSKQPMTPYVGGSFCPWESNFRILARRDEIQDDSSNVREDSWRPAVEANVVGGVNLYRAGRMFRAITWLAPGWSQTPWSGLTAASGGHIHEPLRARCRGGELATGF